MANGGYAQPTFINIRVLYVGKGNYYIKPMESFEKRGKKFQEEMKALCEKYSVEPTSRLVISEQMITSVPGIRDTNESVS